MAHNHPFGLTFDHEQAGKILHAAKEIASTAAIVALLVCIAIVISAFVILTGSGV